MALTCIIVAMEHEEVKVICCDIDGTLVRDDKTLSAENIKWIRKAVEEKGIPFTLVSGRMYNGVKPFYEALGISGPLSCYNGGTLYDSEGNIVGDVIVGGLDNEKTMASVQKQIDAILAK